MDAVRYYVALAVVVFAPGSMLLWFLIHPFVRFWRRAGPRAIMAFDAAFAAAVGVVIFVFRRDLLAVEFGTNPWLIALAVPLFALGVALRRSVSRQLKPRILVGLAEVAPQKYGSRLLTKGIYGRVRHPRYVQVMVSIAALALFANFLATYVFAGAALVWMWVLTPIEEKELRDRFGAEYEVYCARVPRFIPKLCRQAPLNAKKATGDHE